MPKRTIDYKYGDRIISAGDLESRMYVIVDGVVEIKLRDGDDEIVVSTVKKHDFFGEMSLFCNRPRSADVIAKTDVKLVYIESIQQLQKFLIDNPSFAFKMVRILAERLARTDELLIGQVSEVNRLKVTTTFNEDDLFHDM
jgi:CRP/FNR family cyclic AMP-dependent transcriptional regulator